VLGSTGSGGNGGNGNNSNGNAAHGGVLGALQTAGNGTLPFTGFPLWAAVAAAAALILLGLGFRRHGRAAA
jgi:prolipoprotein diacylglyceryltransferase